MGGLGWFGGRGGEGVVEVGCCGEGGGEEGEEERVGKVRGFGERGGCHSVCFCFVGADSMESNDGCRNGEVTLQASTNASAFYGVT